VSAGVCDVAIANLAMAEIASHPPEELLDLGSDFLPNQRLHRLCNVPAAVRRTMIFADYIVIISPAAGVRPSNSQNKVLKAIWRFHDDELGILEHLIHKTARGYSNEFRHPGEVYTARYRKRALLDDVEGAGDDYALFLDNTFIAIRCCSFDGLPGASSLHRTQNGYVLRARLDGVPGDDVPLTFARTVRWLNDMQEQLARVAIQ
jgi:hypothetical protein